MDYSSSQAGVPCAQLYECAFERDGNMCQWKACNTGSKCGASVSLTSVSADFRPQVSTSIVKCLPEKEIPLKVSWCDGSEA